MMPGAPPDYLLNIIAPSLEMKIFQPHLARRLYLWLMAIDRHLILPAGVARWLNH
jgi:hypothetical protein